ncbi:MAG: hypothetical protein J0M16_01655 [Gammaproteobacteria bacterium]|nr:hypothetical protein [Gammaproteobacteria bacterium]
MCGLTVHGLAVARALARHGVTVHAFAQKGGWAEPTAFTRYATVHVRSGLNRPEFVGHLKRFAGNLPAGRKVVLFPTSDRMAATIARHWDELRDHYLLSWAGCRDLVLDLQSKDNLPRYAERSGIDYPRTATVTSETDARTSAGHLRLPVVVKPARPLSSFKAIIVKEAPELAGLARQYPADLPFVVQEFIEGGEGSLYACTMYLDGGREVCALTSRKLAASPPGLGQGTVFASDSNPEVLDLTRRFFAGLDLSGPVALEFKRDPAGRYWMIEPNVGRTEYCVDLAIHSGMNLPCIEFRHAAGLPPDPTLAATAAPRLWFDTDKDPFCYLRAGTTLASLGAPRHPPVFPFAGHADPLPLAASVARQSVGLVRQAAAGLLGRKGSRNS